MCMEVWRKSDLKKTDAQQPVYGSNATGNLRLSQAGFMVNGNKIDQTTYFRNNVFNECDWREERNGKGQETYIKVNLVIDGNDYGTYSLKVTHEIQREASQDNVTTVVHWGDAILQIQQNNVIGKDLKLLRKENNEFEINIE